MPEILVFRHAAHEGPGYLADFLARHNLRYRLVRIDAGEAVPKSIAGISGLVFMGGPMSANDRLPWIPPVLALIREAAQKDVPVLGHCLGGQLMARAFGGRVTRNRVKEIGWLPVRVIESSVAHDWMTGLAPQFEVFHWHGETFSGLPSGATAILKSRDCRHQAFVLGKHLAFQCHVEMTPVLVRSWARAGAAEIARPTDTVQSARQMRVNLVARAERMNRIADVFYARWIKGLK
ncbi:MAG: glutamine amidotransferase [Acidithiobacillales bacterium SM1_46]|jgi:GMP synthase-like glutamine amidotransferase|nr:MAG: glutamine amidotransferase [Acidithiobacillales bacterium SM1_46]